MTTPDFSRTVYYLPGHGGQLHTGLGEGLLSRGWQVTGRATVGDFRLLPFAEQVAVPLQCQIHVGADDWQSVPLHVQALGEKTGIPVTVVPGRGHMLGRDYVGGVLEGWLAF